MTGLPIRFLSVVGWLLFSAASAAAACEQAQLWYQQAMQDGVGLAQRIQLLERSVGECDSFAAYLALGETQAAAGDFEAALRSLRKAYGYAGPDQERARIHHVMGRIHAAAGELTKAVQKYKTAKGLAPAQIRAIEQDMLDADRKLMSRGDLSADQIAAALRGGLDDRSLGVVPTIDLRVQFDFDSAALTGPGRSQVEQLRQAIAELSAHRFRLIGHTDSQGSASYNQGLSERRAETVQSYLIRHGAISPDAIQAEGRGEREPLYSGQTAESHALNRRVEVQIE